MAEPMRPRATAATASSLAKELFGVTDVYEVREFNSFCDRNFYIRGSRFVSQSQGIQAGDPLLNKESEEYVLKILNSLDSKNSDVVDAENEAMKYLRETGFPCPVVYSVKGRDELKAKVKLPSTEDGTNYDSYDSEICIVRMVSLLSGELLESIELTPESFYMVGQFTGRVSKTLKDFSHPALEKRDYLWDILEFLNVEKFLDGVGKRDVQQLVLEVLECFHTNVSPNLHAFRKGTIHGDMNGENLLASTPSDGFKITGLIDFGDIVESLIISEIVVTMVFFIGSYGYEGSGHLLAGYQSSFPIPELEYTLLYYLAAARLCQLVVHAGCSLKLEPNNTYMESVFNKYLSILRKFWSCSKAEMERIWRDCSKKWE